MHDRFEMQQSLVDQLGEEETLDALVRAMGDDQMKDLYDYITQCHDIENINE